MSRFQPYRASAWTIAFVLWEVSISYAQDNPDIAPQATPQDQPAAVAAASIPTPDTHPKIEALQKRIEQLEARDTEKDQRISELESQQGATQILDEASSKGVQLYGFFDMSLVKNFYKKGSVITALLPDNSTFILTGLNLYLTSNITDSLRVLGEVRFSYLPFSKEEYEIAGIPSEGFPDQGMYGNAYSRGDSSTADPRTTAESKQSGIVIERIHATYSLTDWFNVMAGRYLTPFGIWNVDHGSPVVLPVRLPYLLIREMAPLAQTGLEVYGRLFPLNRVFFDYAFTLSNGRGPIERYMDLDENKAMGLRLRLSYERDKVSVAAGGYGYYGKYTDKKKVIHILGLSDEATPDRPLQMTSVRTDAFDEFVIASDLLIEAYGVRFQGEYVFQYRDRSVNPPISSQYAMFQGEAAWFVDLFSASSIGQDFYVLLAYTLPWLQSIVITPYVMYEYGMVNDTLKWRNTSLYLAGINLKPSPSFVLKLEGSRGEIESKYYGDFTAIQAQMAVSF